MGKIETLTPEQTQALHDHAQQWIAMAFSTEPIGDDERARQESAIKDCYSRAGLSEPAVWIRCRSPLGGALAVSLLRDASVWDSVWASVRDSVRDSVGTSVKASVKASVGDSVGDSVRASVGASIWASIGTSVWASVGDSVGASVKASVNASVGASVWDSVGASVWDSIGASVWASVGASVKDSVWASVGDSIGASVKASVKDSVGASVGDLVRASVWASVGASVRDSVRDSVWASIGTSVGASVWASIGTSVWASVKASVKASVGDSVWNSVDPWTYYGGAYWLAWARAHQQIVGVNYDDHTNALLNTWEAANSLSWWWPLKGAVITSDRPVILTTEVNGGVHRLHCETGPAIAWADGLAFHFWHGVRVPADLIEQGWPAERILKEPNAEVRRCAIERLGWDRFVADAQLEQVGASVADPGNPGHLLALYDVPRKVYDEDVRVLLCDNATEERDGTRRRFGLTVPASISDPVAAAAWTFGLNPGEYAAMERAS